MQVRQLMTDNCQAVRADHAVGDAARLMREMDVGMLPVIDEQGSLIGALTDRDIVVRGLAEGESPDSPVEQVMTRQPVTCRPDDEVDRAVNRMEDKQLRRVMVTDGEDHVIGMVSLADLARHTPTQRLSGDVLTEVSRPH